MEQHDPELTSSHGHSQITDTSVQGTQNRSQAGDAELGGTGQGECEALNDGSRAPGGEGCTFFPCIPGEDAAALGQGGGRPPGRQASLVCSCNSAHVPDVQERVWDTGECWCDSVLESALIHMRKVNSFLKTSKENKLRHNKRMITISQCQKSIIENKS